MRIPSNLDLDHFGAHLAKSKSKNTSKTYVAGATKFLAWIKSQGIDLGTARKAFLDDFVAHLLDQGLSPATVRLTCVSAYAYLEWLRRNDLDLPAFMKPVVPAKAKKSNAAVLSPAALQLYLDTVDRLAEPARMACLLLFALGARSFEISKIRLEDIGVVQVDGASHIVVTLHGKGDKDRTVPVPREYRGLFRDYMAGWLAEHHHRHGTPWFLPGRGGPISTRTLREVLQEVRHDLGFSDLTPHILRKTYSTHLSTEGMPPFMIAQLLGHVTDQTLAFRVTKDHYIHHALTNVIRKLDEVPFPIPETA